MTTPDQAPSLVEETKSITLEAQRATLRERLQRRFEVWLDEALNPEAVPQGLDTDILERLDAEPPGDAPGSTDDEDLRSVCAALVGLTETAGHQGVALEQLHQDLPAMQTLAETVSTLLETLAADRQTLEEKQRTEARQRVFEEVLGTVIDMRDRLCAGQTEAEAQLAAMAEAALAPRKRLWPTASKRQPSLETTLERAGLEALTKANQLAITGIDQALTRWHVKLVEGVGQPVDSETTKVVDQVTQSDMPEGVVHRVLRAGYKWNGILCRPAEVCVVQSETTQ